MPILVSRTIFKNEIVSEFAIPARPSKKVAIFCKGMPSSPSNNTLLETYAKKGYNSFLIRYRGSWESRGKFIKKSPHLDVLDVIDELQKSFKDLWSGKKIKINPEKVYVFGGSFGGPAALLASKDPRVEKVVVGAPVIDWTKDSKVEPMDWLEKFVKEAFGGGYRFTHKDWQRLKEGKFYSPWYERESIPGEKALIFHSEDDEIVPVGPSKKFAEATGAKIITYKRGGHYGVSALIAPQFDRHITKFLK